MWNDHYAEFGDAEVFANKVTYDYVAYWGTQAPREYYDKYTDLEFTQAVLPHLGAPYAVRPVQQMFRDWHALGPFENPTGVHAVTSTFPGMWDRLRELKAGLDEETLRDRYQTYVPDPRGDGRRALHKACSASRTARPTPSYGSTRTLSASTRSAGRRTGCSTTSGLTLAEPTIFAGASRTCFSTSLPPRGL